MADFKVEDINCPHIDAQPDLEHVEPALQGWHKCAEMQGFHITLHSDSERQVVLNLCPFCRDRVFEQLRRHPVHIKVPVSDG